MPRNYPSLKTLLAIFNIKRFFLFFTLFRIFLYYRFKFLSHILVPSSKNPLNSLRIFGKYLKKPWVTWKKESSELTAISPPEFSKHFFIFLLYSETFCISASNFSIMFLFPTERTIWIHWSVQNLYLQFSEIISYRPETENKTALGIIPIRKN